MRFLRSVNAAESWVGSKQSRTVYRASTELLQPFMRYPGIWPATFQFPDKDQQFWAPITTNRYWRDPALTTKIDPRNTRFFFGRWQAVGRLKDQVRFQQG